MLHDRPAIAERVYVSLTGLHAAAIDAGGRPTRAGGTNMELFSARVCAAEKRSLLSSLGRGIGIDLS